MSGVLFTLVGQGGDEFTATSNDNGVFTFSNVPPGEYTLTESPLPHDAADDPFSIELIVQSGQLVVADLAGLSPESGQFVTANDQLFVANTLQGAVVGRKFHDLNRNGEQDAGEPGLAGITIELTRDLGGGVSELLSTTTDTEGLYRFEDLAPGDYQLREVPPDHALIDTEDPLLFTLLSGQILTPATAIPVPDLLSGQFVSELAGLSIPNVLRASLHGYVFDDLNGNGVDDAEPRLAGAALTINGDVDGDGNEDQLDLTTNDQGEFHVTLLAPGVFVVTQIPAAGYRATTPSVIEVSLGSGEEAEAIDGLAALLPGQTAVAVPGLAFGNQIIETPTIEGVVQFIAPLSVFRNAGTLPPGEAGEIVPGRAAISGFKWNDIDQDGAWDANEPGRPGWAIELLNGAGERLGVVATDPQGRYVFADLDPGTYFVREEGLANDGPIRVSTFPSGAAVYEVQLAAGQVIAGDALSAEEPNFGGYDYSPMIRPSDDFFGHIDANSSGAIEPAEYAAWSNLITSVAPWQSISLNNPSDQEWTIAAPQWSVDSIDGRSAVDFLRLLRQTTDDQLLPVSFPLSLPAGDSLELVLFYDPAIRVEQGSRVVEQYPDWLDDPDTAADETLRGPHTFQPDDNVLFPITGGPDHRYRLIGGSTFDSDVSYNGRVDNFDLVLISTILNQAVVSSNAPQFDLTADANTRCPNGASGAFNTCAWSVPGASSSSPPREIGLGDIGPLNVEFGRVRGPVLDLDADNSTTPGKDFLTVWRSEAVAIVNQDVAVRAAGVALQVAVSVAPGAGLLSCSANGSVDDVCADSPTAASLAFSDLSEDAAEQVLRRIRFDATAASGPGQTEVEVRITNGDLFDAALAIILLEPETGGEAELLADGEAGDELENGCLPARSATPLPIAAAKGRSPMDSAFADAAFWARRRREPLALLGPYLPE